MTSRMIRVNCNEITNVGRRGEVSVESAGTLGHVVGSRGTPDMKQVGLVSSNDRHRVKAVLYQPHPATISFRCTARLLSVILSFLQSAFLHLPAEWPAHMYGRSRRAYFCSMPKPAASILQRLGNSRWLSRVQIRNPTPIVFLPSCDE